MVRFKVGGCGAWRLGGRRRLNGEVSVIAGNEWRLVMAVDVRIF